MAQERITIDPGKMTGQPCIRNLRMPVVTILRLMAQGWTEADIVSEWTALEPGDVRAALSYAADTLWEQTGPHFEL